MLQLEFEESCPFVGHGACYWRALGRKETQSAADAIDGVFARYAQNIFALQELHSI